LVVTLCYLFCTGHLALGKFGCDNPSGVVWVLVGVWLRF
jgi:hypothetical protein